MEIVQAYKPDLYVALCDGDTNINSRAKRISKAVLRSKTLLEQCLDIHLQSDILKSTGILGPVEGGYNLQARKESIDYLKDKPLAGFVIDGLHNNGPDVQNISLEQIKQVVQYTIVSMFLIKKFIQFIQSILIRCNYVIIFYRICCLLIK